jgi:AcrR family transcriptional regulator
MIRPAQTARSERTREALRQAAVVRFLAQGVEDTSAEQIAGDAGVTLRTFWFRAALNDRPAAESIIDSVQSAIFAFPYDVDAVSKIAALRDDEIDPGRIVRHIRDVQADFADAIVTQLQRRSGTPDPAADDRVRFAVTARCIAAAVFGAMEVWMLGGDRSLGELARVCHLALETLRAGITGAWSDQVSS